MELGKFQKLLDLLNTRVANCRHYLGHIRNTEDLKKISLAEAVELSAFCISEESTMTKIAMVDLYHIIGMGNLTPPQMMQFTYAMRDYLSYRSTIKALAKHLDRICDLPKIPVSSKFKLLGLGNITLGEGELEEASVDDYNELKLAAKASGLPFTVEGKKITVAMTRLDEFVSILSEILKSAVSIDNLKHRMSEHKDYAGIEWSSYNALEAVGTFKVADIYARVYEYYERHK